MIKNIAKALTKSSSSLKSLIPKKQLVLDKEVIFELLISIDMEYETIEHVLNLLKSKINKKMLTKQLLRLFEDQKPLQEISQKPIVDIIIGVNGGGKTTSIAKLANIYKKNQDIILGAGDTFRAAAIEQLHIWADRLDVDIISTKQGHDPSALVYDTIKSAISKNKDRAIIDTAGRLHNQENLKKELIKIFKTASKALSGRKYNKIAVIDSTQGSMAIPQIEAFHKSFGLDSMIITKLDGTSKGGAIFTIAHKLNIPITHIGVGEGVDDIIEFNKEDYIESILDTIFEQEKE